MMSSLGTGIRRLLAGNFRESKDTSFDFYLLANSHGVALLDGITNWREQVRTNLAKDPRYGEAFQGWFDGTIPREPIEVTINKSSSPMKRAKVLVIAGGGIGALVNVVNSPASAQPEITVSAEFEHVLRDWRGTTPIISMIQGNEHSLTMVNRWPPYDFFDPELPSVESGVPIIDGIFIDEYVRPWVDAVFNPLSIVRRLTKNPLAHVLPPPPRENLENSPYLEVLREDIEKYGFTSKAVRLKWYRRYCRALSVRLATIGCSVLRAPHAAANPEGRLRDEYAEGLTHGNASYGLLIASEIESWLSDIRE